MLPLPILDGGKFIHSIIDKKISERGVNGVMWGIYAFTFVLFFAIPAATNRESNPPLIDIEGDFNFANLVFTLSS